MSGARARMAEALSRLVEAGERTVDWARARRRRIRPVALGIALALFFGGLVLSVAARPETLVRVDPLPLLLVAFGTLPLSLLLGALDFRLMARLAGVQVGYAVAIETVLYSRALNLLPVPGSLTVRLAVLKGSGATLARAGGLSLLFTAVWAGLGLCFSAIFLSSHAPWLAGGFAVVGTGLLAICALAGRTRGVGGQAFLAISALRLGFVVIEATTLLLGLRALGVSADFGQSAILVAASSITTLFPAGIGVRETLVAALAPLAGIPAAVGFLAAAALRGVGLAFLAICAGVMLLQKQGRTSEGAGDSADG